MKTPISIAYSAFGLLLLLLIWFLGATLLSQNIPLAAMLSPKPTFETLLHLWQQTDFINHTLASLRRVFIGLLLALTIAVPLGLILGFSPRAQAMSSGSFQLLRMISPLSWMPVIVMLLGIGDAPIYFLLTFAAIWPILLNTIAGIKNINPDWLALAQSLSANRRETLWHIILPAIVKDILIGLRLAIGIVWILLVPCEMLGVHQGLGYFILDSRDRLAYSELMAAILTIGLIGWALDFMVQWAVRKRG